MLYNENVSQDIVNILAYIDVFTSSIGVRKVQVSKGSVLQCCHGMRQRFPHHDGLAKSSTFKKVANFVAWFLHSDPIKSAFPANTIKGLNGYTYNANAVIAFDIAIRCLENSKIDSDTGEKIISQPIYVSDHSYADIICALSQPGISAESHYHLLAVFFEQLTYKSNRQCEYGPEVGKPNSYYPAADLHMDDLTGI